MPYLPFDQNDEEQKKIQAQAGQNISGGSNVIGQSAQNVAAPKPVASSGSWTNLNQYLDANKEGADQMGSNIANNITGNAETAIQKTEHFKAAAPEIKAYDPNQAYNNITSLSDSDKQGYQTAKQGYKGPQSLTDVSGYDEAQKAQTKAWEQTQNAGNELGQQQLLKDTYARPNYSQGQVKLDQLLLQNSAGSRKGFEDLGHKYSGLNDMFNSATTEVGDRINKNIKTGYANQQAITAGDTQAKAGLLDPIRARANQMNADNSGLISRVTGDLSDDTLSQETLDRLGLSEGQKLYGANLSSYLTPDQTTIGLDNAANADERARYAALTALIDGQAGQEISANGKQINPLSFDKARFDSDQAAREAELNRIFADTNFTGYGNWNEGGVNGVDTSFWSSANVAKYLANPADIAISARQSGLPFATNLEDRGSSNSRAMSQADLFRQINDFLNQQNYNRTIKKG